MVQGKKLFKEKNVLKKVNYQMENNENNNKYIFFLFKYIICIQIIFFFSKFLLLFCIIIVVCKDYICPLTQTCVEKPIDCPCENELEKKCLIGDWYIW